MGIQIRQAGVLNGTAKEGILDDGQRGSSPTKATAEFCKVIHVHPAVLDDDEEGRVVEAQLDVLYDRGFLGAHGSSPRFLVPLMGLVFQEGCCIHENAGQHRGSDCQRLDIGTLGGCRARLDDRLDHGATVVEKL